MIISDSGLLFSATLYILVMVGDFVITYNIEK